MANTINTEQQLQAACVLWFHNTFPQERGMLHCNNNNSANRQAGNVAKALGVYPGVADLELLLSGGKVVFIELKFGTGRLSPEQQTWREKVILAGHLFFAVWTLEDFKSLINTLYE